MATPKKTTKPTKPVPPARDATLPRPFEDVATQKLLTKVESISRDIAVRQAATQAKIDTRAQYFLELERRGVSLRAMASVAGISNVAVSRIIKRREGKAVA